MQSAKRFTGLAPAEPPKWPIRQRIRLRYRICGGVMAWGSRIRSRPPRMGPGRENRVASSARGKHARLRADGGGRGSRPLQGRNLSNDFEHITPETPDDE